MLPRATHRSGLLFTTKFQKQHITAKGISPQQPHTAQVLNVDFGMKC